MTDWQSGGWTVLFHCSPVTGIWSNRVVLRCGSGFDGLHSIHSVCGWEVMMRWVPVGCDFRRMAGCSTLFMTIQSRPRSSPYPGCPVRVGCVCAVGKAIQWEDWSINFWWRLEMIAFLLSSRKVKNIVDEWCGIIRKKEADYYNGFHPPVLDLLSLPSWTVIVGCCSL